MANNSDDKWKRQNNPPAPLFFNQPERDFVKQVNDEIIERVIGQVILYYPISLEHSSFHNIYGEALEKNFLPPIKVNALIEWEDEETRYDTYGADKITRLTVHFHTRRLTQDQNLFIRVGDFFLYGDDYYEITSLQDPRLLFGQVENPFEISAKAIKARQTLFSGR